MVSLEPGKRKRAAFGGPLLSFCSTSILPGPEKSSASPLQLYCMRNEGFAGKFEQKGLT
jgi:hypothetical protein